MPAPRLPADALALELEGVHAAWLSSFTGGDPLVEVIVDPPTDAGKQPKHRGVVRYEDIVVTCGAGIDTPLRNALRRALDGADQRYSGAIVAYDGRRTARQRLEFTDATITQAALPALDGASKDVAYLRATFAAGHTRRRAGSGNAGRAAPAAVQRWLQSNFRVAIDGVGTTRVSKVAALGVARSADTFAISDLVLTVPETAAGRAAGVARRVCRLTGCTDRHRQGGRAAPDEFASPAVSA